jgi:hypothetical protein
VRTRVVVCAAAVAAASAAAGALWTTRGAGPLAEGPLGCPDCGSNVLAMPVEVGRPLTYSLMVLVNRGRTTAVLDTIGLLGLEPGFRVLRFSARRPVQPVLSASRTFPDPRTHDAADLRGFRVLPGAGSSRTAQLVIGMRIDRAGVYSFRGIAVSYHVGSTAYRAVLKAAFVVCGPLRAYRDGCPRRAQWLSPP